MWMKLFKKHFYSQLALVLRYECASSTRILAFWISSLTSFEVFLGFSFDRGSTQVNKTKFQFYGVILDFQICLFDFQNWVWIEFEIKLLQFQIVLLEFQGKLLQFSNLVIAKFPVLGSFCKILKVIGWKNWVMTEFKLMPKMNFWSNGQIKSLINDK